MIMNEEELNQSIRRFLKKTGISSQREIEKAMQQADAAGRLDGKPVRVKMTLECELLDAPLCIEEDISY